MAKFVAKYYLIPYQYVENEMSMEEFLSFEEEMWIKDDYENAYYLDTDPKD